MIHVCDNLTDSPGDAMSEQLFPFLYLEQSTCHALPQWLNWLAYEDASSSMFDSKIKTKYHKETQP
jgi:hypothetical protein